MDSWRPRELSWMRLPSLAQAAHTDASKGGGCSRCSHGTSLGAVLRAGIACLPTLAEAAAGAFVANSQISMVCGRTLAEAAHAHGAAGGGGRQGARGRQVLRQGRAGRALGGGSRARGLAQLLAHRLLQPVGQVPPARRQRASPAQSQSHTPMQQGKADQSVQPAGLSGLPAVCASPLSCCLV